MPYWDWKIECFSQQIGCFNTLSCLQTQIKDYCFSFWRNHSLLHNCHDKMWFVLNQNLSSVFASEGKGEWTQGLLKYTSWLSEFIHTAKRMPKCCHPLLNFQPFSWKMVVEVILSISDLNSSFQFHEMHLFITLRLLGKIHDQLFPFCLIVWMIISFS